MIVERRSTTPRGRPADAAARDDGGVSESPVQRARRKFAAGALEQAAQILGATAASVLVVGLVGPYIAALAGSSHIPPSVLGSVVIVVLFIALGAAGCAVVLRGLSRRTNDDGRFGGGAGRPGGPMTVDQDAMMTVAHTTTGAALVVILVIFLGGVALYLWTRRSR